MEGDSTEPKKFSYPNADRNTNDSGEITGPAIGAVNENIRNEQRHPTVHLADALQNDDSGRKPNDLQNIRTFQSDVANAVRNDNVSLIKIALAEKKRQERQGTFDDTLGGADNSNKKLVIGVIVIILLVAIGGFFFWSAITKTNETPIPTGTTITTPPLEAETNATIDVRGKDNYDVERLIQTEKATELSLGSMERINFIRTDETGVPQQLTSQDWFAFLKTRAPSSLTRSFEPGFIYGIYALTPNNSFIILKVNSYDNAYAGMLTWEPNMEDDIGGIIINPQLKTISENGVIASTTTNQFEGKPFVDRVINNKDARVLLDDAGKTKMLYTFTDQSTLVIASSESALREIVFRLTTGRISR